MPVSNRRVLLTKDLSLGTPPRRGNIIIGAITNTIPKPHSTPLTIDNGRYVSTSKKPIRTRGLAGKQTMPRIVMKVLQNILLHFPIYNTCKVAVYYLPASPHVSPCLFYNNLFFTCLLCYLADNNGFGQLLRYLLNAIGGAKKNHADTHIKYAVHFIFINVTLALDQIE